MIKALYGDIFQRVLSITVANILNLSYQCYTIIVIYINTTPALLQEFYRSQKILQFNIV